MGIKYFYLPECVRCPVCGASLAREGGSLYCGGERRHTYDIAKEGYVNLLPPGRAKNARTGDGADMIRARERFLSGGGYDRYSREAARFAAEFLEMGDFSAGTTFFEKKAFLQTSLRLPTHLRWSSSAKKLCTMEQDEVSGDAVPKNAPLRQQQLAVQPTAATSPAGEAWYSGSGRNLTDTVSRLAQQDDVVGSLSHSGEEYPKNARGGVPATLVDAGCGEGRHTVNMAHAFAEALGVPVTAMGFDASKFGVQAAAKRYVRGGAVSGEAVPKVEENQPKVGPDRGDTVVGSLSHSDEEYPKVARPGIRAFFAAGNIFSLPVSDGCADVFTSLFAPLPEDEARRVLRQGGILLICAAGAGHLAEMRELLYDNPIPSGGGAAVPAGFECVGEKLIEYPLELSSNEEIMSLFTMTPFYHNAPPEGRARLEKKDTLTVTVQVKCTAARRI